MTPPRAPNAQPAFTIVRNETGAERVSTFNAARHGLFYQIALRLTAIALLFTLLNIAIILTIYVRDKDELAQDLISSEAERIADRLDSFAADQGGTRVAPLGVSSDALTVAYAVYGAGGEIVEIHNPEGLPLTTTSPVSSVRTQTQREDIGEGRFRLSGIRQIIHEDRRYWIAVLAVGHGLRPFAPAVLKELIDHAILPLIPLAMLLILLNIQIVRHMLSPLERAVAEVDAIDPTKLGRRLPLSAGPTEVRTLVSAFNRAVDRMESLIQILRDFTADAAHELRTPLAIMSLSIEKLPDGEAKRSLQADATGMTRLVSQLLDMARADALQIPADARARLVEVVTSVIAQLTPLAVAQHRTIDFRPQGTPIVTGQADMLERAVRNIIENALSHTPSGTAIEVSVGPEPMIAVRDHGPGVAPEELQHVFKRFWRADRRGSSGSGLGLGIAARIVEVHKGAIRFEDAPGGGALITLAFPVPAPRPSDRGPML